MWNRSFELLAHDQCNGCARIHLQDMLAIARELEDALQEASALFVLAQMKAARIGREQKPGQDR